MIQSVSTNVDNSNQRTSFKDKAVKTSAAVVGGTVGLAVPYLTLADNFKISSVADMQNSAKFMSKLMPEIDTFENTAQNVAQIMKETGLDKKGVKFHAIDKNSASSVNELKNIINNNVKQSGKLFTRFKQNVFNMFKEGANAAYFPDTKDVIVGRHNLYSSAYHELGHAMNANGNFATKALQKARNITPFGVSLVAPIVLAVGLLHKVDKTKPEEEKSKLEKTADFVSNNAGKLTLASYVPLLAEEGLASIRGVKHAAKHLSPDKVSKLAMNYTKAWGTYAATAGLIAGGVALGVALAQGIKNKYTGQKPEQAPLDSKVA